MVNGKLKYLNKSIVILNVTSRHLVRSSSNQNIFRHKNFSSSPSCRASVPREGWWWSWLLELIASGTDCIRSKNQRTLVCVAWLQANKIIITLIESTRDSVVTHRQWSSRHSLQHVSVQSLKISLSFTAMVLRAVLTFVMLMHSAWPKLLAVHFMDHVYCSFN